MKPMSAAGGWAAAYSLEERGGARGSDWTVFCGDEPVEAPCLAGDGRTFRACFNGRLDPRRLRVEYEAVMKGPGAAGMLSDLSCHIGPVCFAFGSRRNTFTGITGPGEPAGVENPPLIVPGRAHRVAAEIDGCECRLEVDGRPAGALRLTKSLEDGALTLYTWAGEAVYRSVLIRTPDGLPPLPWRDAPHIREKRRLHDLGQSIVWIEHTGKFLHECSLPGEGRDRDVYPAHPNGIQVSRDRFLLLYSTRAYRGDDDEKSGVYQLRRDAWDGPVLKEGWICRTCDDWDPLGDGKRYVRQHGHPVAFGVPKGALMGGRRAPHENVFGVIWRCEARWIDPATGFMAYVQDHPELAERTAMTEWLQFRLNAAEDDIQILQPAQPLRQAGFESGPSFCAHAEAYRMTGNFVLPVPYNADASEWVHADTLYTRDPAVSTRHESLAAGGHNRGAVAILRFRFNAGRGLYEWVQTGPLLGRGMGLFEGSVLPYRGSWIVMARRAQADTVAWMRTDDLFGRAPEVILPADQPNAAPACAYLCPDGVLRRTGGRADVSPYGLWRDPLYLMDIDPDRHFAASNVRAIFDARHAGVPVPSSPIADFAKLLPHTGGRVQRVVHRVRSPLLNDPKRPDRRLTRAEIEASGIYGARIHYREEWPATWAFV